MKLRKFEIRNYKCISHASFLWEDLIILIGENNSGKSSVLSAIATFLSGGTIRDSSFFHRHQHDFQHAIELIGHFHALTPYEMQQTALRGRTVGEEWILKKRYWHEDGGEDGESGGWKEQLFSFSQTETYREWPESDNSWNSFPAIYHPLIEQIPNRGPRPSAGTKDALRGLVRRHHPELVQLAAPTWVPNPGGGGNWKSNANSILPKVIFVRAVHEASEETNAKEASTYGKLINLIVERSLVQRAEMNRLQNALNDVLALFRPNEHNPDGQAHEIRELQERINAGLNQIVAGEVLIRTEAPELLSMVMPSTSLAIRDIASGIATDVSHQGHGLQRTLVMTLLQQLANAQADGAVERLDGTQRATLLLVEEPELYLHPQMERLMRDVLFKLSRQDGMQVACCTHSPVFLDIADEYRSIVRMFKNQHGDATCHQVTDDIFQGHQHQIEKSRLKTVAQFDPTVNELFFAKNVVLMEEFSAIAAIERGADVMGLFQRHPRIRREVSLIDCNGKENISAFQRILNAFEIPYRVIHDADVGNPTAEAVNPRIAALILQPNCIHMLNPDLEGTLGYRTPTKNKPYIAVTTVEQLHIEGALPLPFQQAICMVYFGQETEPREN